ncbi:hypothetical protein VTN96DRAFT_5668 [Rasamsonia emersonii]
MPRLNDECLAYLSGKQLMTAIHLVTTALTPISPPPAILPDLRGRRRGLPVGIDCNHFANVSHKLGFQTMRCR